VLDDLHGVTSLDGGNVVLDFVDPDGTGSASLGLAKRYLYGNAVDQILAQEDVTQGISDADRVYWPLVDHLGTVRDLYQNDATSAQHYKYDSFGTVTAGNSALSRYLYTARELDPATDLQYNRARWLHGAVWISNDPIGFASGSANLIQYTLNRPLITSDASGLAPPVDFSTMSLAEIIGYYRQQVPAVTQSSTNLPPADWAWTPWSRSSVLDGIPTIYLQRIPSVAVKVNVTASQLITYYSNTSGAAPGPMGCGPCTGAIVYPTYAPADMPTPNRWGPVYVFHLSPGAALPDITLPSQSYSAVINGVIPTTPTDLYSRSHLYTLSQMIAFLRQRRVRIVGYTPVSSIHLYDGTVYLGAPPGFNPN
jgi:RHS repeat-associated protein